MRVPILYMGNPAAKLWLTDEPPVSPQGQPVLIDATSQVYQSSAVPSVILIKYGTCGLTFYEAARKAGYQVVWLQ
jgi:hypothetical protein